jgi:hypothetical protein
VCRGEAFAAIHSKYNRTEPFFWPTLNHAFWHAYANAATHRVQKLVDVDTYDIIIPAFAHDDILIGVVDFYPQLANDWKMKSWKDSSRWGYWSMFEIGQENF